MVHVVNKEPETFANQGHKGLMGYKRAVQYAKRIKAKTVYASGHYGPNGFVRSGYYAVVKPRKTRRKK